jgi:hypothetical protein
MARPPKNDDEKRSYFTPPARLTEEENTLFHELVLQSGLSKSDFVRHAILNKKINVIHKKGFAFSDRQEFRALANNLNQMTLRFHATDRPPPSFLADLLKRIDDIITEAVEE